MQSKFIMKYIAHIILLFVVLSLSVEQIQAQSWTRNRKDVYSVGVGITQSLFLPIRNYPLNHTGSMGLSINMSGEYKVHRFIGLGWQTGVNIYVNGRYYNTITDHYYNSTIVGIPIGAKVNFHILEATQSKHKDRLDFYAGMNIGGGPAFHRDPYGGVFPFFYVGPHAGIRYWGKSIAFFAELGWGATIANIGFSF